MAEEMVRASGGFSRANMQSEYNRGYNNGVGDARVGNAQAGDVLATKTFTNSSASGVTGSMQNRGKTDIVIPSRLNTSQRIPEGYHNGQGVLSVAAPSGTRNLAANETGNVDLYPYDYQAVNASAVYAAGDSAGYNRGVTAGYAQGHADWQTVATSTANATQAAGRVTSVSGSYTASKAGILLIYVSAVRYSSSASEPTLSGMQIQGSRRVLSGTLYSSEDKPSSAPERAFSNSGIWAVEVAAGATVSWSLIAANSAYIIYNHTLIAI